MLEIDSIREELQCRIDNINDPTKKASRAIPAKEKINLLLEYCTENNSLPPYREEYKGAKIGSFLDNLLGGNRYKNDRDDWIAQLLEIDSIREELQKRIDDRNDTAKKASRTIPVNEKINLLLEFCTENGCLPPYKEEYKGAKIGIFLNGLLGGRNKNDCDEWISQLLEIVSIREELQCRIDNRNDLAKKASRAIPSKEKISLLLEYCTENNCLPTKSKEYKGAKIGIFLNGLLGGKIKNERDEWLAQLLEIDSIREELQCRIDRRAN